ncbi:secreted RxLR effector protein 161-like [Humulus lupulus]|uniref:secreted RxLR effector protein 161-like n=1 Tax=Humulus lupulus TaxID=3486 RepID=UPI002B40A718|nr:secreted RxLR effector protein 161-like [Humulus lupulus]
MDGMMYAMISTRPNVVCGIGLLSRFMSKPSPEHWKAVKWLLRYETGSIEVVGYYDSDFAGDLDKRMSISGCVFSLGGNTISWKSSLQHVVALPITEVEYIALP